MKNKTSITMLFTVVAAISVAQADVLCISKAGKSRVAGSCNANETTFQGSGGSTLSPGGTMPCGQAVLGVWSGYLSGSAYNDLERCSLTVGSGGSISGSCWSYLTAQTINMSGGVVTVSPLGTQSCDVSGSINFVNGVTATIKGTLSVDQNGITGVHWNTAGGDGTFNAVRVR